MFLIKKNFLNYVKIMIYKILYNKIIQLIKFINYYYQKLSKGI